MLCLQYIPGFCKENLNLCFQCIFQSTACFCKNQIQRIISIRQIQHGIAVVVLNRIYQSGLKLLSAGCRIRGSRCTTTASGQPTPSGAVLYGDTNLDGRVDITDAVMLNKAAANTVQLSEQQRSNADCDANNEVDSNDAVVLLKFLVSIIKTLPEVAE